MHNLVTLNVKTNANTANEIQNLYFYYISILIFGKY